MPGSQEEAVPLPVGLLRRHPRDREDQPPRSHTPWSVCPEGAVLSSTCTAWTPMLPARLCLGEMQGRGSPAPGGTRPLPTPACALRTPSTQRVPGHERFCSESRASPHGCSLPGLSVGLGTQVQAGESLPRGPSASSPPWGQGATPRHWAWRRQGGAEGWGVRQGWAESWGPGGGEVL